VTRTDRGPEVGAADPPLAILAGGGAFPLEVAGEARRAGRDPFLIGVVGATDSAIEAYPHVWVRMGEVGKLFAALKERAIAEMVIIGAMTRPDFADLRLDWGAVKRAAGLAQLFRRGDNGLLAGLAAIIEREGVRVVGAHEVAPRLLAPFGPIGARAPSEEDETDIAYGARLLGALSAFDAGQGAIVAAGRVLAIEAAEGTDAMLARVAEMRANGRLRLSGVAGVLVKAPKRGQDLRLDMPAVGPKTIEGAVKAQLRGVAIAAGRVLVLERALCACQADAAGLFVAGFAPATVAG
jgi:UDP-2,3-diacylglucosamine hydrolase